jgi:hypothetical protein
MDAMDTTENETIESPLQDRNINTIGKQTNVNAYQYDNPEVKPYYKEMAQMLSEDISNISSKDNRSTVKGGGTKLSATTSAVKILHNEMGYSYDQIRNGLEAIINDHGQENNALSKKIEIIIDDQLRNGYRNSSGKLIQPNQNYIDLINKGQEQSDTQTTNEINTKQQQYAKVNTKNNNQNYITNNKGEKLDLYHGTPGEFKEFDKSLAGRNTQSDFTGIYFTDNPNIADEFSYEQLPGNSNLSYKRGKKGNVYTANIKANNVLNLNNLDDTQLNNLTKYFDPDKILDTEQKTLDIIKSMNEAGNIQGIKFYLDLDKISNDYDAVIADMGGKYKGSNEYIVFDPKQIEKKNNNTQINYNVQNDEEILETPIIEGKQRKHYKSVANSDQVTKETRQMAKKLYNTETYTPISNIKTITETNANIKRNGVERTYESFMNKMLTNERVTLQDISTGERLIQIYSQQGDTAKVNDLIQTVAILGTELGQQVQALSLIRRASPEGQLAYLQKVVERTNIKEGTDIKVTDDMAEKILNSSNEQELQENVSKVAIEVANQLPIKFSDKMRSWRYLSMLGNPRTHIRNLSANVAMNLTQSVKNKVAGAGEDVVGLFKNFERTKTLKPANKDQRAFAKQDAEAMKDLIDGGGKYDIKNLIQSNKKQFDTKVLNAIANFNTNALDFEDKVFLKMAYKQAMQNYMSANKLSSTDMQGKVLQKAREYASLQAQEATFHQFNSVANAISNFENKNTITKLATSAIMPFKKTPMNIAKTGIEYSPINIAHSVGGTIYDITKGTRDLKAQLEKGNITQEQYNTATSKMITNRIDQMAKGLTGSSIALLGFMLASQGILKAGNDDKDDEFEEKLGKQTYSIQIGDNTYTLDWMSPTAIPLFTGATVYQMLNSKDEEDKGINSYITSMAKSLEPMTEMSMLQGLANAISSYENGSNMFFDLGASMGQSYAGQYIPTALGQVTKTIDPNVRDTTSTKKGIEKKLDQFIKQSASKIPGLSYTLPTKTDVWGNNKVREGNIVQRYFNNAIAPYNKEKIKTDKVSNELVKVYNNTGEASVLPTTVNKKITINSKDYTMTSEEFAKYKKQYGQNTYKLLKGLTSSSDYKKLTSEQKQIAIDNLYKYAKEEVKVNYSKEHKLGYESSNMYNVVNKLNASDRDNYFEYTAKTKDMNTNKEKIETLAKASYSNATKKTIYENSLGKEDSLYDVMKDSGVDISEYLKYKTQEFESDKQEDGTVNGKTVSGSKKKKVYEYVNNMKINYNQKLLLLGTQYNLTNDEKTKLANYVNGLSISKDKKLQIYGKLSGFTVYKDGRVKW